MERTHSIAIVPTKLCARQGCGKALTRTQRRFCSHICRNMVLSPGNQGGAPEKYRPEFTGKVFNEYLAWCEKGHEPTLIPTKSSYLMLQNARLPTLESFCEYLGANGHLDRVSPQTLYNWAQKHEEFARVMDRLKRIQKTYLINNGLSGRYNARLAQFQLNVNHGQIERKQMDANQKMLGIVRFIYAEADRLEAENRTH